MHNLITDLLSKNTDGLTTYQIEKALGVTAKTLVPDTLRDMHWRGKVKRLRPDNGDVLYVNRARR